MQGEKIRDSAIRNKIHCPRLVYVMSMVPPLFLAERQTKGNEWVMDQETIRRLFLAAFLADTC
jgi:hypothetical protein